MIPTATLDLWAYPPMLLTRRRDPFSHPDWIFEIKHDGYRLMASTGDDPRLKTRSGADATKWVPEITKCMAKAKSPPAVFDGEVCILDEFGRADFERLQRRARMRCWKQGAELVIYAVFDLLQSAAKTSA